MCKCVKKRKRENAIIDEKESSARKYRGVITAYRFQCGYTMQKYLQYWALLGMSQTKHRIIKAVASLANYKLYSHAHSITHPLWEGKQKMWNILI
jgi:hypothetical protein